MKSNCKNYSKIEVIWNSAADGAKIEIKPLGPLNENNFVHFVQMALTTGQVVDG